MKFNIIILAISNYNNKNIKIFIVDNKESINILQIIKINIHDMRE